MTCELCNDFIDTRFRYKSLGGKRFQHMEQRCFSVKSAKFIVKELADNPNHPTNMYLNKGPDRIVDRDCAVLDGHCDCPNTGGSVPNSCKYLKTGV